MKDVSLQKSIEIGRVRQLGRIEYFSSAAKQIFRTFPRSRERFIRREIWETLFKQSEPTAAIFLRGNIPKKSGKRNIFLRSFISIISYNHSIVSCIIINCIDLHISLFISNSSQKHSSYNIPINLPLPIKHSRTIKQSIIHNFQPNSISTFNSHSKATNNIYT